MTVEVAMLEFDAGPRRRLGDEANLNFTGPGISPNSIINAGDGPNREIG
jgi:hypothetical protein